MSLDTIRPVVMATTTSITAARSSESTAVKRKRSSPHPVADSSSNRFSSARVRVDRTSIPLSLSAFSAPFTPPGKESSIQTSMAPREGSLPPTRSMRSRLTRAPRSPTNGRAATRCSAVADVVRPARLWMSKSFGVPPEGTRPDRMAGVSCGASARLTGAMRPVLLNVSLRPPPGAAANEMESTPASISGVDERPASRWTPGLDWSPMEPRGGSHPPAPSMPRSLPSSASAEMSTVPPTASRPGTVSRRSHNDCSRHA